MAILPSEVPTQIFRLISYVCGDRREIKFFKKEKEEKKERKRSCLVLEGLTLTQRRKAPINLVGLYEQMSMNPRHPRRHALLAHQMNLLRRKLPSLKSKKRKSCKRPSEWPIDTGASSHMTDQLKLFRGPLETLKKKRQIQVGGGILWSEFVGLLESRQMMDLSAI